MRYNTPETETKVTSVVFNLIFFKTRLTTKTKWLDAIKFSKINEKKEKQ